MIENFLTALHRAFVTPTSKQRGAYGRFLHNLAAACVIADTSLMFPDSRYGAHYVAALFAAGVVCFVAGALLSKGD